jgi:predicted nucleic acid-binding Zn ribbon protein
MSAKHPDDSDTFSTGDPELSTEFCGNDGDLANTFIRASPASGSSRSTGPHAAEAGAELADELPTAAAVAGTDLAAGALEAARAIAGRGRVASGQPGGRFRRRRNTDGPSYSGARPDERDPVAIGSVVKRAVPELGWVAPLAEARLMSQWETVVGAEIAARCHPVSLVDGDLKVAAESTAWATQLRLMAPQILAKITAELPRGLVKRVVISGPSGPSWKHGPWSVRGRGIRDTYG